MPTAKRRTQVTQTKSVKHALEVAKKTWPGETRESVLLGKLIAAGAEAVEHRGESQAAERRKKLRALGEKYGHIYGPGYLEEVREGWDE